MSAELAIFTGCMGDENTITVVFSDHNNVKHYIPVDISVGNFDKPRMLEIQVAGKLVATFNSQKKEMTYHG